VQQHTQHSLSPWQHDHRFDLHLPRAAERRVKLVTLLTVVTMVVEIVAGQVFGSMALLADGLHMGSHAMALGLSALAYLWMRRRAGDVRFSLGTGKISALAGYTGALMLLVHSSQPVPIKSLSITGRFDPSDPKAVRDGFVDGVLEKLWPAK